MPAFHHGLMMPKPLYRRLAAMALFALQGAIVLSPFVEPRSEARLGAHVEQPGTRHVGLHNEATCALCSARAQTSMPAQSAVPVATARQRIVATSETYTPPSRIVTATNRSRAPPQAD